MQGDELCQFPTDEFGRPVRLRIRTPDGTAEENEIIDDIDEVIIRHGPVGALRPVLGRNVEISALVDQLGREEHWRQVDEFNTPKPFTRSPKIAFGRAVQYMEDFELRLRALDIKYKSIWIGWEPNGRHPAFFVDVDDANRTKLEAHVQTYHGIRVVPTRAKSLVQGALKLITTALQLGSFVYRQEAPAS